MDGGDTVTPPDTASHALHAETRLGSTRLVGGEVRLAAVGPLRGLLGDHGGRVTDSPDREVHLGAPRVPHRGVADASHVLDRAIPRLRSAALGAGEHPVGPRPAPPTPLSRHADQTAGLADVEVVGTRRGAIDPLYHLPEELLRLGEVALSVIAEGDVAEGSVRIPTPEEIGGAVTREVTQRVRAPAVLELEVLDPADRVTHGAPEGAVRPAGRDTRLAVARPLVPVAEVHPPEVQGVVVARPAVGTIEAVSALPRVRLRETAFPRTAARLPASVPPRVVLLPLGAPLAG